MRALYFWARWLLATGLLNTSAGIARLARKAAPRPIKIPQMEL
jgi:hypothetical protein